MFHTSHLRHEPAPFKCSTDQKTKMTARQTVCHYLLQVVDNENLTSNICCSVEASFHVFDHVNRHILWRRAAKRNFWMAKETHVQWYGWFSRGLNSKILHVRRRYAFFGQSFLDMLTKVLVTKLRDDGIFLKLSFFKQDEAPPRFANFVREHFNENFLRDG
jgi:hypothetical protein